MNRYPLDDDGLPIYPDWPVGTKVTVGPEYHGDGHILSMGTDDEMEIAGPTRHPYNVVVRHVPTNTTWHCSRYRIKETS